MDAGELRDRVRETLDVSTSNGDTLSFHQLVDRVTTPGECTLCMEGPVRRTLIKLLDEGAVHLVIAPD